MIDHLSIGTADLGRAKAFYDATLGELGYRCLSADHNALGYGRDAIGFWILQSSSPPASVPDSGLHVCLRAPDSASVQRFHRTALQHGGSDNGPPGNRRDYGAGYYAAFVADPDGYRIEAYCDTGAETS
jgi:catechol 2,3-dioxygenase-like lactoylglutathione lyase family enzyme